ncbi:hypothetical protein COLO4_28534 [Corchorus olitorius]|uniref:Uncharacterized protein n=1 Tax=Corchorus olitorius TaxID=93759 RepID=A0A1R3HK84_9ROSI|nr:hypothetical protein COLO4_28534 [Corchorus olitorius]
MERLGAFLWGLVCLCLWLSGYGVEARREGRFLRDVRRELNLNEGILVHMHAQDFGDNRQSRGPGAGSGGGIGRGGGEGWPGNGEGSGYSSAGGKGGGKGGGAYGSASASPNNSLRG